MALKQMRPIQPSTFKDSSPQIIDWRRLGRRALILCTAVAAVIELYRNARLAGYGFDFHGGAWRAGSDVLAGRSPYPQADPSSLLARGNEFITPPPLAVFAIPFSLLPYWLGVALWNVSSAIGFAGALRVVGIRDWRVYAVALCSWPFVVSLIMGQPDGLFALLAAVAWRWRGSQRGAVACGALIAAKLFALPLLVWLLATRRFRLAAIGAASAGGLLVASWACIGFKGLGTYPSLLAADARAFETRSHSVVAAAMRLGASEQVARVLAVVVAAAVAGAMVRGARRSDLGYFAAALLVGLMASPILWSHYLVLLLVPLAVARPRLDVVWLLTALFYLSPIEPPPSDLQVIVVLLTASAIAIRAVSVGPPFASWSFRRPGASSQQRAAVGHSTFV